MGRRSKNKRPADDQSGAGDDDNDLGLGTSSQTDRGKTRPLKKSKTVTPSTTESSRLVDDAIDAVLSQTANNSMDTGDDVNNLTDTITQLVKKVQDQQQTIAELTQQVSFLLSYLGVEAVSSLTGTPPTKAAAGSSSSSSSSDVNQQTTTKSYASITAGRPVPLSSALKQAVVSAVYRDFEDKDRRNKNVVVNGLPPIGDDTDAVKEVLTTEFGPNFNVLKCRRLGRPQHDKVQPILVTMESDVQASYITTNARQLRQSTNETIRKSVFINPDLTRAEAFTAYQDRCERRQRATKRPQRPSSSPSSSSTAAQSSAADVAVSSASPSARAARLQTPSSMSGASSLNTVDTNLRPTATTFIPSSSATASDPITVAVAAAVNNNPATSSAAVTVNNVSQ